MLFGLLLQQPFHRPYMLGVGRYSFPISILSVGFWTFRDGGSFESHSKSHPKSRWRVGFLWRFPICVSTVKLLVQPLHCQNCRTKFLIRQVRFWGWSENKREEERDFKELSQLAKEGKPLYGESPQPEWVQGVAHRNSAFSQLKFCELSRTCVPLLLLRFWIIQAIFPM
jgi:hypothetical protein